MWKKVLAATTVLAIAGSSFVYAQRAGGPDGNNGPDRGPDRRPGMGRDFGRDQNRWQPSQEDMGAFADARIAGMKAGLRLTPDQEKNWPAFESAYRGLAQLRIDRETAMREMRQQRSQPGGQGTEQKNEQAADQNRDQDRSAGMVERMQRNADAMAKRANAFKQFADTAAPLYKSLDDSQKRRFGLLARMLRPQPMRFARGMDRNFERDFRQDFGPGGQRRMERGFDRPRFGAAEGPQGEEFAANPPPAQPDLADFDLAGLGPDFGPEMGPPDQR
jgi:hypothetical protein